MNDKIKTFYGEKSAGHVTIVMYHNNFQTWQLVPHRQTKNWTATAAEQPAVEWKVWKTYTNRLQSYYTDDPTKDWLRFW